MPQITQQDLQDQEKFNQLKTKIIDRNTFNLGYLVNQYEAQPTNTTTQKNLLDAVNARLSSFNNVRANYADALANQPGGQRAQQFKPQYESILNQLPDYLKPQYEVGDIKPITNSADQAAFSQQQYQEQQQTQAQTQQAQQLTPEERAKFNIPETTPKPEAPTQQGGQPVTAATQPQQPQAIPPAQGQEQLAQTVEQQAQTNPNAQANTAYVNGVFQAYHGRDANQQELDRYSQMNVAQALKEIKGGAPQALTSDQQGQIQDLQSQGFQKIDNPAQLSQLARDFGVTENDIVRVGNQVFAPSSTFALPQKEVFDIADFADPGKDFNLDTFQNASGLDETKIAAAVENYVDQYYNKIPTSFDEARSAYWNEVMGNQSFATDTYASLQDEYNIDEINAQLTDIDKQIASRDLAWNTLLEDARNQPESLARITGKEAHIRRMASIELQGLLGQRDAITGDLDRANQRIETALKLKLSDRAEKIDALKTFYDEQKEFFQIEDKRRYEAAIKQADQQFELQKQDLSDMRNLMTKYPTAGISLNDDFGTAVSKAGIAYMQELSISAQKGDFQFVQTDKGNFVFNKDTGEYTPTSGSGQFNSNDILKNIQKQGLSTSNINGRDVTSNTILSSLLQRADADMKAAGLGGLQINQDFRTKEQQAKLYEELSAKGARVAPPGTSFHELGLAVDVTNWEEAQPYLARYGIVNGLPDDMGHFSIGEMNPGALSQLTEIYPQLKPITPEVESLKSSYDLFSSVANSKGLNSAVGVLGISRIPILDYFGAKQDFILNVEQMIDQKTLDTLINVKAQGATFGALSEGEVAILQSAATKIAKARKVDEAGNIIGYGMSEKSFKDELTKLKTQAYNALDRAGYSHLVDSPTTSSDILETYNIK